MKPYPQTPEEYKTEIGNKAYSAVVRLFERAEYEGIIIANGHHCAQHIAVAAMDLFTERLAVKESLKTEGKSAKEFIEEFKRVKADAEG